MTRGATAQAPIRAIARSDYWRCAPERGAAVPGFKEWHHFCVLTEDVDLLVNFSVMDGVQTAVAARAAVPRLALLARTADGWRGAVQRLAGDAVDVKAGQLDARFGGSAMRFVRGTYEIDLSLEDPEVEGRLRLTPLTTPAITEPVGLGTGGSMRWLVLSRLSAWGTLRIAGRHYALRGAPAYHDHDWGYFRWGAGFAWNWTVALPAAQDGEWTVTSTQVTDAGRNRLYTDSLMVWRGGELVRSFRNEGITTSMQGALVPPARPLRTPAAMWLAAPGEAFDVPRRYEVRAEGKGDVVELDLALEDYAQIAIPADFEEDGTCVLSEIRGCARARGRVRGSRVVLDGPAVLELLHVRR